MARIITNKNKKGKMKIIGISSNENKLVRQK
jgi:hypothetical protein